MSLTSALHTAQSALINTARQTQVVSGNISNAHDPNYTRRQAATVSMAPGVRTVAITRMADEALFRQNLSALSGYEAQNTLMSGLDRLRLSVNGADNKTAVATTIGKFQEALQLYSATPSNRNLAEAAVEAARSVVRSLNQGSQAIQSYRAELDARLKTAVGELNTLLADFNKVNREVVSATRTGRDPTDALDQRDALLKKISEFLPISTMTRGDNDMVIMTGDGSTLYETIPREVTFDATIAYAAGTVGNAIRVDGVPIQAGTGGNTSASGTLAAMMQLRDDVAVKMQAQLDETARGLITSFSEGVGIAGLFEAPNLGYPGGGLVDGLAAGIRINPDYDSSAGGDPENLRDGASVVLNPTGAKSYPDQLLAYLDALEEPMAFDPAAGISGDANVMNYTANALGWLEANRQSAFSAAESKGALAMRTEAALSNATGVNIDQEMTMLLDLEHSYAASARMLQAVNEMLATLMASVR